MRDSLGVTPDDDVKLTSLNAVASQFLAKGGEPEKIYNRVHKLLRSRADIPIPAPLEKLAAIRPFKLFVSTTFDSLLAQAINAVRFGGVEYTKVVAYSPRDKRDLPGDVEHLEGPLVFQLLGKVSPMQDYVVTEEDALEFIYSLQATGLPVNLFSALDERPLEPNRLYVLKHSSGTTTAQVNTRLLLNDIGADESAARAFLQRLLEVP